MNGKKIILLGPVGYGKSSTGCTLTGERYAFGIGKNINRVSLEIEIETGKNGITVVDCPGIIYLRLYLILFLYKCYHSKRSWRFY
jgi:hypothetical protein